MAAPPSSKTPDSRALGSRSLNLSGAVRPPKSAANSEKGNDRSAAGSTVPLKIDIVNPGYVFTFPCLMSL